MGDEFKDASVDKPIMIVTGGKVVDDNGNRYWWPEEGAEASAQTLGEGWQSVGWIDETMTLSLEATDINPTLLAMLQGGDVVSEVRSPLSIVIETTDIVSGAPPYPTLPLLDQPWYLFHTRRRVIRERGALIRQWEKDYAAWVADGRPDREVLIRRFIPNARIVDGD